MKSVLLTIAFSIIIIFLHCEPLKSQNKENAEGSFLLSQPEKGFGTVPIDSLTRIKLHAKQDSMYKAYLKSKKTSSKLRKTTSNHNWRDWVSTPEDQGSCGDCWVHAATGVTEAQLHILYGSNLQIDLDELEVPNACNGGLAAWAENYIINNKIGSESGSYPNLSNVRWSITSYNYVDGIAAIKVALENGPVTAAFEKYADITPFFSEHPYGVYRYDGVSEYQNGHAVVIVDYDSDDIGEYWICKNSGGDDWADGGFFRIGFGECLIESWENTYVTVDESCFAKIAPNLRTFQDVVSSSFTTHEWAHVLSNTSVSSGTSVTFIPNAYVAFDNNASLTVNGTLTANGNSSSTPITFDFVSPNSSTQNGIRFNSGSSGTINYCQIRNAYRGIYENNVTVDISNSAISGCTDGIYLYCSDPLIQYCNIHDNSFSGINLTYSSPTIMWSNYIHNNVDGVYCSSSSAPQFGDGVYGGENNIRDNTYGVVAWNNANPMLGNTSPSDGGYNNLVNTSFNVYNMTSNVIYARENWWGTTDPNNFKNSVGVSSSPYRTSELYIPSPPLSKATGNLVASSSEDIPMLPELDKAYKLADAGNLEEARNICMNLITNYPDYNVSYNALNLLKETYDAKDLTGKKNIYASLFNNKAKKNIHAMAGLILAHVDKENKLKHIDDVLAAYGDDKVTELALYDKFVYFYFDKEDIENAKAISGQLDKRFPGSQASIEAHRVLGDKEYFNASPKQEESSSTANKEMPKEFQLSDNYPNPFNPTTVISYQLSEVSYVTLKIYDVLGREVTALVNGVQKIGKHVVYFNASNLSSGIYFYQLRTGNYSITKKMISLK